MLPDEFDAGINRLVKYFDPKSKFNNAVKEEFRRVFSGWTRERWNNAIDVHIETSTFFPRINEMRKAGKADERPEDHSAGEIVNSCEHCSLGRIAFIRVGKTGIAYERYLACSCLAGDKVQFQMQTLAKNMGMTAPRSVRYADEFSGLESAKKGLGHGMLGQELGIPLRSAR
jgi:hypothetical protein